MYLYHGTASHRLDSIRARGLCPGSQGVSVVWPSESHPDSVYFTEDFEDAERWAIEASMLSSVGVATILRVRRDELEALGAVCDDDRHPRSCRIVPQAGCVPPNRIQRFHGRIETERGRWLPL